jgi:hypothetical protein
MLFLFCNVLRILRSLRTANTNANINRPSYCITHAPGHMLVLDDLNESLALS